MLLAFDFVLFQQILAGLLDQYLLAGNTRALKMATWMVEYFFNRVQNVISKYSVEHHWNSLNEESGGMNDVLYRLYTVTVGRISLCYSISFIYSLLLPLLSSN